MQTDTQARQLWANGSYETEALQFLPLAGRLVTAAAIGEDDRVLDIGTGTGNVAISAARQGAQVTGLDITPRLLDIAKENASTAAVTDITWREGTATDLPFTDDAFDVTLSCLGHMYADPPAEAGHELLRVTKSGGHVGFLSWTPTSLYPSMAGVLLTAVPPEVLPDYSEPPFMWGDQDVVTARIGDEVTDLTYCHGTLHRPTLSPAHVWEETAQTSSVFGPAVATLDEPARRDLRADMIDVIDQFFDDAENTVELEYLLVTATTT